jgi:hypothetical protein
MMNFAYSNYFAAGACCFTVVGQTERLYIYFERHRADRDIPREWVIERCQQK